MVRGCGEAGGGGRKGGLQKLSQNGNCRSAFVLIKSRKKSRLVLQRDSFDMRPDQHVSAASLRLPLCVDSPAPFHHTVVQVLGKVHSDLPSPTDLLTLKESQNRSLSLQQMNSSTLLVLASAVTTSQCSATTGRGGELLMNSTPLNVSTSDDSSHYVLKPPARPS